MLYIFATLLLQCSLTFSLGSSESVFFEDICSFGLSSTEIPITTFKSVDLTKNGPIQCCQAENQTKKISKSDIYQALFLPKIRPKADPNSLFLWSKSDLFHKLNCNISQINFHLKNN